MIRTLVIVAITGFVLAAVAFAGAFAIAGGPFSIDHDLRFHRQDWINGGGSEARTAAGMTALPVVARLQG